MTEEDREHLTRDIDGRLRESTAPHPAVVLLKTALFYKPDPDYGIEPPQGDPPRSYGL